MPDLFFYSEPVLRVALFLTGAWVAGHYLCAGNLMKKAPHYIKALLMPCAVVSGVGMSWAAWHHGSGVAVLFSVPAVICMSLAEFFVWRAGAFIADAFDLQESIKEASAKSLRMSLRLAQDGVDYVTEGIVTDSGLQELQAADRRSRERCK